MKKEHSENADNCTPLIIDLNYNDTEGHVNKLPKFYFSLFFSLNVEMTHRFGAAKSVDVYRLPVETNSMKR